MHLLLEEYTKHWFIPLKYTVLFAIVTQSVSYRTASTLKS